MDTDSLVFFSWTFVAEKVLRSVVVYVFLVAALRVFGKREMAQLNPLDLVVLLTLSNAVQNAIIGNDNSLTGGMIGATALLAVNYVVISLRYRFDSRALEAIVAGKEDILIRRGKVDHERLRKELMTLEDLKVAARRQGFASLGEVEWAAIEPGGVLTFVGKRPSSAETQFSEIHARLDEIAKRLDELKTNDSARRTD